MTTPFHMVWCIPRVLNKGIPQSPSHKESRYTPKTCSGIPRAERTTSIPLRNMVWCIPRSTKRGLPRCLEYTTSIEKGYTKVAFSKSPGIPQRHVVVYLEVQWGIHLIFFKELRYTFILPSKNRGILDIQRQRPRFHFATWFGVYHDSWKGIYHVSWWIPRLSKRGIPRSPSRRFKVYPKDM